MVISQDKMSLALINERETIAKIIRVSEDAFFLIIEKCNNSYFKA